MRLPSKPQSKRLHSEPIELPRVYFDRQQALVNASGVGDYGHRRTTYQGMIGFMDEVIGNISESLRVKQMYSSTIIVYSSDNGGPSFTASHHLAANNYPLRGSKATDLEGGVRVGAFISGVSCRDVAGIWLAFFSKMPAIFVADRGSCRRTPGRLSVAASAASFISLT